MFKGLHSGLRANSRGQRPYVHEYMCGILSRSNRPHKYAHVGLPQHGWQKVVITAVPVEREWHHADGLHSLLFAGSSAQRAAGRPVTAADMGAHAAEGFHFVDFGRVRRFQPTLRGSSATVR